MYKVLKQFTFEKKLFKVGDTFHSKEFKESSIKAWLVARLIEKMASKKEPIM